MKTSNYLLLTLIFLFFGSFILVGWNADAYIERRVFSNNQTKWTVVTLPKFSAIVAEKRTKIYLINTPSDGLYRINIDNKILNTIYRPFYKVRHDTLFIKVNPNTAGFGHADFISIECPEIKSFIAKPNSEVIIVNAFAKSKQLFLLDNAKLYYQYNGNDVTNVKTKSENNKLISDNPLTTVKIIAKQSEIKFLSSKTRVDLDLDLSKSYFHLAQNVATEEAPLFSEISGFLKNDSRVDLYKYDCRILKMNLKGDKTSTFFRSNY